MVNSDFPHSLWNVCENCGEHYSLTRFSFDYTPVTRLAKLQKKALFINLSLSLSLSSDRFHSHFFSISSLLHCIAACFIPKTWILWNQTTPIIPSATAKSQRSWRAGQSQLPPRIGEEPPTSSASSQENATATPSAAGCAAEKPWQAANRAQVGDCRPSV